MRQTLSTLAIVVLLATITGTAWAEDDMKGISGYGCFPQSGKTQADFSFEGGAIRNRATTTRNVVCTIFRDKYTTGFSGDFINFFGDPEGGPQVDSVKVFFFRRAEAGSNELVCQVLVRDLTTGTVTDSQVDGDSSTVGFGFLAMENLSYAGPNGAIYLFCKLPSQSEIRGLRWEEDVDGIVDSNDLPLTISGTEFEGEGEVDDDSEFCDSNPFSCVAATPPPGSDPVELNNGQLTEWTSVQVTTGNAAYSPLAIEMTSSDGTISGMNRDNNREVDVLTVGTIDGAGNVELDVSLSNGGSPRQTLRFIGTVFGTGSNQTISGTYTGTNPTEVGGFSMTHN